MSDLPFDLSNLPQPLQDLAKQKKNAGIGKRNKENDIIFSRAQ